jgi:hypothetical protein
VVRRPEDWERRGNSDDDDDDDDDDGGGRSACGDDSVATIATVGRRVSWRR